MNPDEKNISRNITNITNHKRCNVAYAILQKITSNWKMFPPFKLDWKIKNYPNKTMVNYVLCPRNETVPPKVPPKKTGVKQPVPQTWCRCDSPLWTLAPRTSYLGQAILLLWRDPRTPTDTPPKNFYHGKIWDFCMKFAKAPHHFFRKLAEKEIKRVVF